MHFAFFYLLVILNKLLLSHSTLLFPQSIPWGLAYHIAVQKEAAKIPSLSSPTSMRASGVGAGALLGGSTLRTKKHSGPAAMMRARLPGGQLPSDPTGVGGAA